MLSKAATMLLAGLGAGALAQSSKAQAPIPRASTVNVTGNGSVTAMPDRGWVRFGILAEEKEAVAALDANARALAAVLEKIRAKGIEPKDVQTQALGVRPKYQMTREGNREVRGPLVGYVATVSLVVTLNDPKTVQTFAREFPIVGPVRIADVGYFSSKAEGHYGEALTKAVQDARRLAEIMAKPAGLRLGPVIHISFGGNNLVHGPPRDTPHDNVEDNYGTRIPVEPSMQSYAQSVEMSFGLR